ncbi:MAG: DUF5615 family PIN-like protein [bacterium]
MTHKVKFYTDEQVPSAIVKGLRLRGVDVVSAKEAGKLGATDEDHIAFAMEKKRVIFTQDVDFLRLHAKSVSHGGIVYAHQRTPIGEAIRGLTLIYQVLEYEDMKNHLEFL